MLNRSYFLLTACLLLCTLFASAQNSTSSLFADSSASTGDYMLHIEEAYQALDRIRNEGSLRLDILAIRDQLDESDTALKALGENLSIYTQTLNIRNLQTYRVLLLHIQEDLKTHRERINTVSDRLQQLKTEMGQLRKDSLLRQLIRDSTLRRSFITQLKDLRGKWRETDSSLQRSIVIINQLKTHTSSASIKASEMLNKVNAGLTQLSMRVFGKERNFLWNALSDSTSTALQQQLRKSYQGEKKALNYYLEDSGMNRFLILLFAIAFYWWLRRNIRRMKRLNATEELSAMNIAYILRQPLASTAALVLCIAPLFDLDAPAGYIGSLQFFLLIVLTILCLKHWPRRLFYYWLGVVVLFFLFAFSALVIVPTFMQRLWFILLNILSIGLWLLFLNRMTISMHLRRFIRIVLMLNIALNVFAILCNIYGRLTLSQIFGTTAIAAFIQAIALAACYRIFMESLLLQVVSGRLKRGIRASFDAAQLTEHFRKPMLSLVLVTWAIVFTTHLNIYTTLYQVVTTLLARKWTIGSISFTLGSIALFLLIIWTAHALQRYISYFFGEVNDDDEGIKGPRSRLIITRLIVLSAGYLLAVAASGLPVDKITIVLGALGVGIGMGLQNIVNNFVSGIILIFDRPLQIGDAVEVGSTAGRVKEIGLRSSTLFTADGAEVIIPNGDILSQQITNWTLSNNNRRITLSLSVLTSYEKDKLVTLLKETILASPFIYQKREPSILIESVTDGAYALTIYFWCTEVQKAEWIKSEIRYQIYHTLRAHDIVVQ